MDADIFLDTSLLQVSVGCWISQYGLNSIAKFFGRDIKDEFRTDRARDEGELGLSTETGSIPSRTKAGETGVLSLLKAGMSSF
jgi:hypothetical protein